MGDEIAADGARTPRPISVLLAGGGTAGHVNPLLAVAQEFRRRDAATTLTVIGTEAGLEATLVPAQGLPLVVVPRVPLPRRPTADWFRLPARLRAAVRAAGDAIDAAGADVVVGFGGYVSTPAYLAARRRRVPVVVHEANSRPGLANRLGARWARHVAVTFPGTRLAGAQLTGLPLRAPIADLVAARADDAAGARTRAAATLGLDPERRTLAVTGGSLGALAVNAAVSAVAAELVDAGVQVVHLTGAGKAGPVQAAVDALPGDVRPRYQVREYHAAMQDVYAVADLVVCRAGAGTVCELTALGLPAVYVPLPVGNGEQRLNATPVVTAGGGLLVDDDDFTPDWVRTHVLPLLRGVGGEDDRLAAMGRAAATVGVVDGAARVADLALDAAREARTAGGAR